MAPHADPDVEELVVAVVEQMNLKWAIEEIKKLVRPQTEVMETPTSPGWMELLHPGFAHIAASYACSVSLKGGVFLVTYHPMPVELDKWTLRQYHDDDDFDALKCLVNEACKRARETSSKNPQIK